MIGMVSWLSFGFIAGSVTAWQMAGRDKVLIAFTIGVGLVGSLAGGFGGSVMGVGDMGTFSMFSLLFAALGAALTLLGYRKAIGA